MGARGDNRCRLFADLESAHDKKMKQYILLAERQTHLFRHGHLDAARDLDRDVQQAKAERDAALEKLLAHISTHERD